MGWVTCLNYAPRSGCIISGARDRTVRFWDSITGKELRSISVLGEPPAFIWISPDERLLAISSQSFAPIKIVDVDSGKFVGNLPTHGGMITSLAFSPDGSTILTVEQKGIARLWDTSDFKALATLKISAHYGVHCIFSIVTQNLASFWQEWIGL